MYNTLYQYQPRQTEIIHVNGENGARALQMMPNSQALLLDDTAPLVWLATTDGAGYKTVVPYTITPYEPKKVSLEDIEARLAKVEELIRNEQSNTEHAESEQSE